MYAVLMLCLFAFRECVFHSIRFINVPRATMDRSLKEQEKELSNDISNLNKKSKYLEKQHLEANNQLRDIVSYFKPIHTSTRVFTFALVSQLSVQLMSLNLRLYPRPSYPCPSPC